MTTLFYDRVVAPFTFDTSGAQIEATTCGIHLTWLISEQNVSGDLGYPAQSEHTHA